MLLSQDQTGSPNTSSDANLGRFSVKTEDASQETPLGASLDQPASNKLKKLTSRRTPVSAAAVAETVAQLAVAHPGALAHLQLGNRLLERFQSVLR